MNQVLKKLMFIPLVLLLTSVCFARPTETEFKSIMNLSGKQRMLSQKMAKEALMVVKGIDVDNNRQNLQKTVDLFNKTLAGLKNGDASLDLPQNEFTRIHRKIDALQTTFDQVASVYKNIATGGTPSADDLTLIAIKNVDVLTQANKIVSLFEIEAKSGVTSTAEELSALINISGRQRMLSQKMTKEFLLIQLDIKKNANSSNLKSTINLFDTSLKGLKSGNAGMGIPSGVGSQEILAQLEVVTGIWDEFKSILQKAEVTEEDLNKVKELNMKLLQESNAVVLKLTQ